MIHLSHSYYDIISRENLLISWREFIRGKRKRHDVQVFALHLSDHISELHTDLHNKTYRHGSYEHFQISDPKPRDIHKATVRDRLVHHAVYRILYPFFGRKFTADSFSCRLHKGTHRALNRFRAFAYQVSKNHTKTCWVLKCDIRKFFANIDHAILLNILSSSIPGQDILWLLGQIIGSFNSGTTGKGLPLGNLTSQLFVNIYMNEFDRPNADFEDVPTAFICPLYLCMFLHVGVRKRWEMQQASGNVGTGTTKYLSKPSPLVLISLGGSTFPTIVFYGRQRRGGCCRE